jgi:hypothetical protein
MSQVEYKTQDRFEYAIWHDNLPGSTFGVRIRTINFYTGFAGLSAFRSNTR